MWSGKREDLPKELIRKLNEQSREGQYKAFTTLICCTHKKFCMRMCYFQRPLLIPGNWEYANTTPSARAVSSLQQLPFLLKGKLCAPLKGMALWQREAYSMTRVTSVRCGESADQFFH